ncbi:MAG: ribonuclease H [Flavobacteriaceae bacterium]|nr:ribonuclease H [Flavobacteriaceae bacterium]|tara:strand:+ start:14322 stop:14930 length:609 start_codon:yes stop_codon:yes gene_type:complete
MSKEKFYVVWKGHNPGIYLSWSDCQNEVKNVKGALYRSYKNLEEAKGAFSLGYKKSIKKDSKKYLGAGPELNSISVDAASSGNPGIMEYQGVDTRSKKILFKMGPFKNSTNNIGEFLALVHGIAMMENQSEKKTIYSDSITAISWVNKKKCQTKLKRNKDNNDVFILIERAIFWLKKSNFSVKIKKWETKLWGEIPADFGRK